MARRACCQGPFLGRGRCCGQTVMTDEAKGRRVGGKEYKYETDEDLERVDHLLLW